MKMSRLSPARIARSLVTVLVVTLIQTVIAPVLNISTPTASAATLFDNKSNFLQYTNWQTSTPYNHAPFKTSAGTAEITSNADSINLTADGGSQIGFLWNTQPVSITQDFVVSGNYYFGAKDGADGIIFSMRPLAEWANDGTLNSSSGGASVFSGVNEIRVFFDTYQNGSEIADDHLTVGAVNASGAYAGYTGNGQAIKNSAGTTVTDVETNANFPFTIRWIAASRTLKVYAGLNSDYEFFSQVISTTDFNLSSFYWGWGAYTGGAYNFQALSSVTYHVGPTVATSSTDKTVTDGASVTLNASYTTSETSPTTRWEYSTDGGTTWTSTGVSSTSYTFTATRSMTQRKYRFYVESTAVGVTLSNATTPVTLTVNPLPLGSETDTSINTGSTRFFYAPNANSILPGTISTLTMEAWVKPSTTCDGSYYCSIFASNNSIFLGVYQGKINYIIGSGAAWCSGGAVTVVNRGLVPSGSWTHVALVRNSANVKIFINGSLVSDADSSCNPTTLTAPSNQQFGIGYRHTLDQYFYGSIDEARIWTSDRSASVSSDMNSNETSTANLIGYWNFNEGSGGTAYNQVPSALASSDFISYGTDKDNPAFWDAASISSVATSGVYTVRTFYRSYITSQGGWKVSPGVSKVTAFLVGGGGGGGGTGSRGWSGGGGAGGRVVQQSPVSINSGSAVPVTIGQGGNGGSDLAQAVTSDFAQNGGSSTFNNLIANGGGAGGHAVQGTFSASPYPSTDPGAPKSGGGGGAQAYYFNGSTTDDGFSGGTGFAASTADPQAAGGGAGSAGNGGNATSGKGGNGGVGVTTAISGTSLAYGGGGGGGKRTSVGTGAGNGVDGGGNGGFVAAGSSGTANRGGGGGGAGGGGNTFLGGYGGSGVVIIRWITASVPTYTKPINAYLNVGMTETFTTDVAVDSATVGLTRTFRWESTTTGSAGTFTLIKQGTGAANAAFSWIPTDTRTSGANYLYRLIVTDSDTAGLFISDSSTAYAVINLTLQLVSKSSITKSVSASRAETFAVSQGTPTYTYSISPPNPFFWVDTLTATTPRIRIADTATVGTYYETFTVTDSVSASISVPLTITISAPPSFSALSAQVDSGTVLYLDAGNTVSYPGTGTSVNDISGRGLYADLNWSSGTTALNAAGTVRNTTSGLNNITCAAPSYNREATGSLVFNGSNTCGYVRNMGYYPTYSYDLWIKRNGSQAVNTGVLNNPNRVTGDQMNYILTFSTSSNLQAGIYNGTTFYWTPEIYIPARIWTHVAVTFDGSTLSLIINGETTTTVSPTVTWNPAILDSGLLIGRKYNASESFDGSIASLRFYSRALSLSEIRQNLNATKPRFDGTLNENTIAQKYASRFVDTYTVTAGSESITATFTTNALSGIKWDTSTARTLVLSLQDTLTPGTYYDTITATDIYGVSSKLPLTFNIAQADSLTVSMDTGTVITYNGVQITSYPKPIIKGLKGSDTATSTSRFSSTLYSESTVAPTNADTYTVRGTEPVFSVGSLSYYAGVIYETSTAVINKAKQRALNIFMYGGVVGLPYYIYLQGGNGTGAVTESLTGLATLSGCAVNNHYLTAVEQKQGFCEVRVVKAGDQNYYSETQTVQLYFMAYVNNQPTNQVGSGSTIALNGKTSLTIDDSSTVRVPRISGFSKSGTTLTINGEGFGSLPVTITFERYVNAATQPTPTLGGTVITVAIPGTAVSGPVLVITAGGRDSIDWLDLP